MTLADIAYFTNTSRLGKPAHAVLLDRSRKHIMVVVRGSDNWKDYVTDAAGLSAPWQVRA